MSFSFKTTGMNEKKLNEVRDSILDSSLISTTFCEQQSNKELYDTKIVWCNNYIQIYNLSDKKLKNKKIDKDNNILKMDTDNLITQNTKTNNDLKQIDLKNIIRSKLECQRLAKCNSNDWHTFITLTFKKNIKDIVFANREFNKFISKVRRIFNNLKYICVPEFQKRGAIHYHLLTNIDIADNNLIYEQIDNKKFLHIKYWNNGFDKVDNVSGDIKKIIGYISKYMTKDIDDRLFGKHRYLYSQNLNKPCVSYLDLSNPKHILFYKKLIEKKELIYKNVYENSYNNDLILFEEYL